MYIYIYIHEPMYPGSAEARSAPLHSIKSICIQVMVKPLKTEFAHNFLALRAAEKNKFLAAMVYVFQ